MLVYKKNLKNHGLLFHYNIREDPMLVISYVVVRQILCSCSACFRKLASPLNRSQDKYNQDRHKVYFS